MDPNAALAALLDPDRLGVAGALIGQERTTDEIADRTGLPVRTVLTAVGALRQVGLVEPAGDGYTLPVTTLRELSTAVGEQSIPMDPSIGYGMSDDEQAVLSRFFRGRTLDRLPAERAKRLVVLERLSLEFDLGRHYPETEVNDVLHEFHQDVATLRRHLVDEGFLDRADAVYWRAGGRYPRAM